MRTDNMPVETAGALGVLKWLVGLVLAPWLWHERKRVDELTQKLNEQNNDHYTKKEVKEAINDKTEGLKSAVSELSEKINVIQATANATNVTLARIDERMKRDAK